MKRVEINDAKKIANLAGINKNNLSAKENQQKSLQIGGFAAKFYFI